MGRFESKAAAGLGSTQSNKCVIGLDRDGTINTDIGEYITNINQFHFISGSLEAIHLLRNQGHQIVILTNQAGITKGIQTTQQVDAVHQYMLNKFGEAGIRSIDGLYYSTSNLKDDEYAKPNTGMFKRAQKEIGVNWPLGYYVGDKITDLKAAQKIGTKPVLVLTGHGTETLQKLQSFANRNLKKRTLIFENLLAFSLYIDQLGTV